MTVKPPRYVKRYLERPVVEDLRRKMVFVAGPRQVGKTTFAKHLLGARAGERYLNWDVPSDRADLIEERFPAGKGRLVLDEIHKYSRWRQVLKGLYDGRGGELEILVTGSARLDHYRRGGDSLQGRYHFHRLLPFSAAELGAPSAGTVKDLLAFGGFPEPFMRASERETRRWSREYHSRLIDGDLRDLERVHDLGLIERLALRLPALVGSPLSVNGLREDLRVAHRTVVRWLAMLDNLYLIFRLYPFGAPSLRAVKHEAKHYHFDWTAVNDPGTRFENLMAVHLLKWVCHLQDAEGRDAGLRYFRDIDRREVDFVLTEDGRPVHFIECRTSGRDPGRPLRYLKQRFPDAAATRVSLESTADLITREGIRLCPAHVLLAEFV